MVGARRARQKHTRKRTNLLLRSELTFRASYGHMHGTKIMIRVCPDIALTMNSTDLVFDLLFVERTSNCPHTPLLGKFAD